MASASEVIMFVFGDRSLVRDVVPMDDPELPSPQAEQTRHRPHPDP